MNCWKNGAEKLHAKTKRMARAVLDSSAILAVLHSERGTDAVIALLERGLVSAINYAEVVSKLVERGSSLLEARRVLARFEISIVDFDARLAERTGALRADTRRLGLSLADRACLALAERESVPVVTADRAWVGAVSGIEVRIFR
jgi:ribonuclease VapC